MPVLQNNKSILTLFVQFIILVASITLIVYFINGSFDISNSGFLWPLNTVHFVILLSWLVSLWLTHKYKPKYYQRKIPYVMAPFLKAGLIMIIMCWILSLFFIHSYNEKSIVFFSVIVYFFIEYVLFIVVVVVKNLKHSKSQINTNINVYDQHDLQYDKTENWKIDNNSIKYDLKYFDKNIVNELFENHHFSKKAYATISFIKKENNISTGNFLINVSDILINDIKNINKYQRAIYKNTLNGGYVLIVYKDLEIYEAELLNEKTSIKRILNLINYFLFKRIIPKIRYLSSAYFILTKGKNKAISKAEVWGRLFHAGFEVVNEIVISGLSYCVARKAKTLSENPSPSYYPLIALNRVSLYGNIIKIHKIRSMYPYSEFLQKKVFEEGNMSSIGKADNDFRITKHGKIFRKYWIDELPQVIDWLRGEIKLVGIRAMSQHFFSLYPQEYKDLYFEVKPGIISPIFDEKTNGFPEIIKIEQTYLEDYLRSPFITDFKYFFITLKDILKGAKST